MDVVTALSDSDPNSNLTQIHFFFTKIFKNGRPLKRKKKTVDIKKNQEKKCNNWDISTGSINESICVIYTLWPFKMKHLYYEFYCKDRR